jgi:hypothetical protein
MSMHHLAYTLVILALPATAFAPLAARGAAGAPAANRRAPLARQGGPSEVGAGPVYTVVELVFAGPTCGPTDMPAKTVDLGVRFRHESGEPVHEVCGFWDGDGKGGTTGNVFKVRFCPTKAGRWLLEEVRSLDKTLAGQKQGGFIVAVPSGLAGFWTADPASPGGRWYQRSDGSHPYVFGNTHYSFLSGMADTGPSGNDIAADMAANARYLKKVRFALTGCRYPHPTDKPFFDNAGHPTDDGAYSHRPNPAWHSRRVDVAVRAAFDCDLVADLILSGPDMPEARCILAAKENAGDPAPYLRYIAARYGSFPNVWMCLANEWDIKSPRYTADEIRRAGLTLRRYLPYPTPVSVHGNTGDWKAALNSDPPWNDHLIIQHKIKRLAESADAIARSHALGGGNKPVINDELGYQGDGDGFSRDDVIEGHLGAFLGGGYGTTSFKPAAKKGQYFWGRFNAAEHSAAPHLGWLRTVIDKNITFWKMAPVAPRESIFANAGPGARAMAWPGQEFVLGTSEAQAGVVANLPAGFWQIKRFDAIAMEEKTLADDAAGTFTFDAPASRAVLFHFKRQ